jgi:hypothetical protein
MACPKGQKAQEKQRITEETSKVTEKSPRPIWDLATMAYPWSKYVPV